MIRYARRLASALPVGQEGGCGKTQNGGHPMKAITIEPKKPGTARYEDSRTGGVRGLGPRGGHRRRRLRDRRRDGRGQVRLGAPRRELASCSVTGPSGGCSIRVRPSGSRRATWWSASSGAPTRCPAPAARSGSGTCAATGSTPSGGSRRSTASCRSAGDRARVRGQGGPALGLLGVLLEPTTVVVKAGRRSSRRACARSGSRGTCW